MTDEDRIVKLYVRVPSSLHRQVRIEAAVEDRSMSQVVTQALRSYFQRPKGAAPRKRK
jgi:predicted HicB family RNase H-like nuclease